MTAPEPSGCAITGDAAAHTAAALLTADPPEIAVIRTEMANAHVGGAMGMYLGLDQVAELLGAVDHLREQLTEARRHRKSPSQIRYAEKMREAAALCAAEGHPGWREEYMGVMGRRWYCVRCPASRTDDPAATPPGGEG